LDARASGLSLRERELLRRLRRERVRELVSSSPDAVSSSLIGLRSLDSADSSGAADAVFLGLRLEPRRRPPRDEEEGLFAVFSADKIIKIDKKISSSSV
jgi:hypothetical protein